MPGEFDNCIRAVKAFSEAEITTEAQLPCFPKEIHSRLWKPKTSLTIGVHMRTQTGPIGLRMVFTLAVMLSTLLPGIAGTSRAAESVSRGGEANLVLPPLDDASLVNFGGLSGHTLLLAGLVICGLGLLFGLIMFAHMRRRPVHRAMLEISELIYETCKTYLSRRAGSSPSCGC